MSKTISLIPIALGLFTGLAFAAQPGDDPRLSNPAESRIAPASSETQPMTAPISTKATGTITKQDASQILVKELIGVKTVNQNEKIGKVEDILLERDGKIAGVVLAVSDTFGIGDKLIAVPWKQVKVITGDDPTLRINMDVAQLKAAPHFESAKPGSANKPMPETQQR